MYVYRSGQVYIYREFYDVCITMYLYLITMCVHLSGLVYTYTGACDICISVGTSVDAFNIKVQFYWSK